ncbi:TPA: NAD(P)H-dependent oxidoreductase [Elizabethkingia anophelis]|nr:NAD(P)H-dependent oxidoreductase [Elizabethkingia anophelis]HBN6707259.1 NAD(P)H-dependent oxidoreductase [Elizabethkingia anophelis]HBN6711293.1 NAD(P)H-dependent oxidoreductase [Elizabethkingia anophelis]HBN6714079.1 NAD(P)H-dependent oxidoreductase [Elizabethkingia anophelis]HBN6719617.1 NAD(P)H-dependent oxidoreductase [Elizabethkingia anophelis]
MKKLLHIISSPRGEKSKSGAIAQEFLKQYKLSNPDAVIDELNLWDGSIPPFDGNKAAAKMTFFGDGTLNEELQSSWDKVVEVTERFSSADEYLITVPMWNGGIPWVLKHYIDTISQPGLTFGFGADGYFPLLKDKKACVVFTSGVFSPGVPASLGLDFQVSYINWWLGLVGITDIHPITFLGNLVNPDAKNEFPKALESAATVAKDFFA